MSFELNVSSSQLVRYVDQSIVTAYRREGGTSVLGRLRIVSRNAITELAIYPGFDVVATGALGARELAKHTQCRGLQCVWPERAHRTPYSANRRVLALRVSTLRI